MSLYFWEGSLLFRNGSLAKGPDCCCGAECSCADIGDIRITVTLSDILEDCCSAYSASNLLVPCTVCGPESPSDTSCLWETTRAVCPAFPNNTHYWRADYDGTTFSLRTFNAAAPSGGGGWWHVVWQLDISCEDLLAAISGAGMTVPRVSIIAGDSYCGGTWGDALITKA